ncbi:MAG TPA: 1-pyrroline-5-carboxylate dehydrogenase, partial [Flavobacteriales bacterium]|nr:1-pyrroline-5-carboxylate dehydrogenase [Flavobacteriales bacterium]
MSNGFFRPPTAKNEVVKSYKPGSPEREELIKTINQMKKKKVDVPMHIGGEEVRSGKLVKMRPPHDLSFELGSFHQGDKSHVEKAIKSALAAKDKWAELNWEARASIFLKAAELLA